MSVISRGYFGTFLMLVTIVLGFLGTAWALGINGIITIDQLYALFAMIIIASLSIGYAAVVFDAQREPPQTVARHVAGITVLSITALIVDGLTYYDQFTVLWIWLSNLQFYIRWPTSSQTVMYTSAGAIILVTVIICLGLFSWMTGVHFKRKLPSLKSVGPQIPVHGFVKDKHTY